MLLISVYKEDRVTFTWLCVWM